MPNWTKKLKFSAVGRQGVVANVFFELLFHGEKVDSLHAWHGPGCKEAGRPPAPPPPPSSPPPLGCGSQGRRADCTPRLPLSKISLT